MKKNIIMGLVIVFMLIIDAISPLTNLIFAEGHSGNDLGNIFTLEVFEVDGEPVVDGDLINIDNDTEVTLRYGWELVNHQAVAGDFAQITVPDAFVALASMSGDLMIYVDDLDDFVNVGVYQLDKDTNILRLEFNENIEDLDVFDGFVQFNFEFNIEYFSENVRQSIPFNDSFEKEFQVIAVPSQTSEAISKLGVPDSFLDANTITWTIDIMNTSESSQIGFIEDVLDQGLLLDVDSFTITPLTLGYYGDVSALESEKQTISTNDIQLTADGFRIDIPEIDAFSGYRVQYITTFSDFNKLVFDNEVTFNFDDDQVITAVATVSGLTRSNIVEKNAIVLENNEIRWIIDVNKSNSMINDAIIEDILEEGLSLKEGSIEVTQLNLVNGTWQTGSAYTSYTTSVDGQEIIFELGDIQTQAIRISYVTSVEFLGDYKQSNTFENNAILKDGDLARGGDTSSVTIIRPPILSKTSTSNVSFDNKTISWSIRVNQAQHFLENVTLTDTLPNGLMLVDDSIKVFDEDGVDVSDLFVINTSNLPIISVILGDIGNDTFTINYLTEITDFEQNSFINNATLEGVGIAGTETTTATNTPPSNTFSKSYRGIDYNEKTIRWRLSVNPTREPLSTLKITDTYPNAGLTLVEESIVVTLGGTTLLKDEDYTVMFTLGSSDYKDGFIIEFTSKYNSSNPINNTVIIDFKTSFDPEQGIDANTTTNRVYRNSALFEATSVNDTTFSVTRNAQTTLRLEAWFSGKKQGRLVHPLDELGNLGNGWKSGFERLILWEVYTNYLEQDISETVVISDALDYPGEFIESSIQIVEYEVNPDGSTVLTQNVVDAGEYNVTIVDDQLVITFDDGYDKRLAIIFLTTVPNQSLSLYRNDSSVTIGENEPLVYTASINYQVFDNFLSKAELFNRPDQNVFVDEEMDWVITLNESLSIISNAVVKDTLSTGMVLIEDSIRIVSIVDGVETDVDVSNYEIVITNNDITGLVETELEIQFINDYEIETVIKILYKTVVVKDSGTINNTVSFLGDIIDEIVVETGQLTARQLSFAGGVASTRRGSIIINKTDAISNDSIESTFELYYLINNEERIVEDNEFNTVNGVYRFDNLSYRTYYLREVSAPDGYVVLEEPITIVLDGTTVDANRVKTIDVTNIRTLVLEKTGAVVGESTEYRAVGDIIDYKIIATNTGEETLENVGIIDDNISLLINIRFDVIDSDNEIIFEDVTNNNVTLEPTQALVMIAQYQVTQEDIDRGYVDNKAFAQATYRDDLPIQSEEDEVTVNAEQDPGIEIIKEAISGQNYTGVGDVIEYQFTVTNTGNVTLTNVIITDDLVNNLTYQTVNGNPLPVGSITLAPGDVLVAVASYSVTQLDLDRGEVLNIASTVGQDPNGNDVEDDDSQDVDGIQEPSITIEKSVDNEDKFSYAGEIITYSFVVTNTGNVTLNSVVITDALVENITYVSINGNPVINPDNIVLAPNDVLIATASYVITQQDMNRLEVINQAFVSGTSPSDETVEDDDDATIEGESNPDIDITKQATIVDENGVKTAENQDVVVESVNEWIIYEIIATNTGNITLHQVEIEDERLDLTDITYVKIDQDGNEIEGVVNGQVTLQPNEKLIMRARLDVTQQMINEGEIVNVASVIGYTEDPNEPDTPSEQSVEDDTEHVVDVDQVSSITIDKQVVNQELFTQAGDIIEYVFIVENTGNTTLTNVRIVDSLVDAVTYVSINGEALVDMISPVTLQPNDVLFAVATYVVTQQDVNAQEVINVAQVSAQTPNDEVLEEEDEAVIEGVYNPQLQLEKSVVIYTADDQVKLNQEAIEDVTEWLWYEVVATNIGNITLHNVGIQDDKDGLYDVDYVMVDIHGNVLNQEVVNFDVTLQPNESLVMRAKLDITQQMLDEGSVYNQAIVTANPEDPNNPNEPSDEEIEADDEIELDVNQVIDIDLNKTIIDLTYFDAVDSRIYYLFTITNTGNTTLYDVTLMDDQIVEYTQYILNGEDVLFIEEGFVLESHDVLQVVGYTITTQDDIERGYIYNQAEVIGNDIFDEVVSDEDDATIEARKYYDVSVDKTNVILDQDDNIINQFTTINDTIVYTITVVNNGNAIAYDVSVTDDMFDKMDGIVITHLDSNGETIATFDYEGAVVLTLYPNEQLVVVGNYQVTNEDIENQRVINSVLVSYSDENGEILGDSEDNTVSFGLVQLQILKVDAKDSTKVLAGAQFELTRVETNQTWTITTNLLGIAMVNNLEFGDYVLREIVAPDGYTLSDESIEFTLSEANDGLVTIEVENHPVLPETSDISYHLAMFVLLLLGVILIQVSKDSTAKKEK